MTKLKPSKELAELCYPFIYEASLKCDFEILTDELCRQVGGILAEMPKALDGPIRELERLQPLIYHLNGSIRGQCAVDESDLLWLRQCYVRHKEAVSHKLKGFVLPRGAPPVPQLNAASSNSKKIIRLMVRLHNEERVAIPDVLHRFANVLCNYFFILTILVNSHRGIEEIPFESKSYRVRPFK